MNTVLKTHPFPAGQKLEIVEGDLTQEPVEAIVNAANSHLLHGGGVAGVIARRGGPRVQEESLAWVRQHGPVTHAEPAFTGAGNLPFRYIIHAVGPVWGEGDEDTSLASAVTGSLVLANRLGVHSLAMPAISTGIFGFPRQRAARVIYTSIASFFASEPASTLDQVRLTLYDPRSVEEFLIIYEEWERVQSQ
ncbi:MAG: macro domain-containing protein [Chloroflexi bacterium]|nr:macro domain-containing protein [Chloroflexota bacterium]